jgi:hypothetical protein
MSALSDMRALTRATREYEVLLEKTGLKDKNITEEIRKIQDYMNMVERLVKTIEMAQVLMTAFEASNPFTAGLAAFRIGATVSGIAMSEGSLGGR